MKLIIQIPCFNEAETLAVTLAALPRSVPGFDRVEWLVVDAGSRDASAVVPPEHGVDHVVRHRVNRGLSRAFMTGLNHCLRLGADIIVNTDADNQYNANDIPALIRPIVEGVADIVIGARPIDVIEHFSPIKKLLQKLGSRVVRTVSGADVPDAASGFRAISSDAARRLMVFNDYTYTLETLIQMGRKNMAVVAVPVRVNKDLRTSRLVRSTPSYVYRSIVTIIRVFMIYHPVRFFGAIGGVLLALGLAVAVRFIYFYASGAGSGHIQSLILASILIGMGFQTMLVALVADLLAANRVLIEDIRFTMRQTGPDHAAAVKTDPSDG